MKTDYKQHLELLSFTNDLRFEVTDNPNYKALIMGRKEWNNKQILHMGYIFTAQTEEELYQMAYEQLLKDEIEIDKILPV